MKRIDDFVKLLVGFVIGHFLRDAHQIRDGLRIVMAADGSAVSSALGAVFPYLIIAFVIRNVHASFRYDSWTVATKFKPAYEHGVRGRVWSFSVSVLALFISTYAVEQFLVNYVTPASAMSLSGQPTNAIFPMTSLVLFLIAPFIIYFVWDFCLWWGTDSWNVNNDAIHRSIKTWLLLDGIGLLWLLLCLLLFYAMGGNEDEALKFTVGAFAVLSAGTVMADYCLNANFYFGEIKSTEVE